jgi:hypothetical protein
MIKTLYKIYQKIFGHQLKKYKEPDVYFKTVTVVNKTPSNDEVADKDFILVIYQNKPLWALFRCPCGCRHVISLSLQRIHKPSWTVNKNLSGRPTVYPSVWQTKGCHSHFWIKDGRVYWVKNLPLRRSILASILATASIP